VAVAGLVAGGLLAALAAGAPAHVMPRAGEGGYLDTSVTVGTTTVAAPTVAVDPTLVGGTPDGAPDPGTGEAGGTSGEVAIASKPAAALDAGSLTRRATGALGETAVPVPFDLGGGVQAFAPASASSIVAIAPVRRPLGTPVLVLAATGGTAAIGIRSTLLVDGAHRSIELPRQAASLMRGRIMIVRVRMTTAQRQLIAASRSPRLRVRVAIVDDAGVRHEATRTTAIAAPAIVAR